MELSDYRTECLILGSALNSHNNLCVICDEMTHDLFENEECRNLFVCIFQLYLKDIEVKPATVFAMAKEMNLPVEMSFLLGLSYETTGEEDLPFFIRQLKNLKRNRVYVNTLTTATKSLDKATDAEVEIQNLFSDLENFVDSSAGQLHKLSDVFKSNFKGSDLSIQEYLKKKLDNNANGIFELTGLSTGFPKLDKVTDGLQPCWLYVFGARPSEGKTQFLLNILHNVAIQNIPVLFFSLELPCHDVGLELATINSRTSHKDIMEGTCDPYDFYKINDSVKKFENLPLFIDDQPSLDVNQIRVRVKKAIRNHGIKAIFIDYLQEVRAVGRHSNNQEAMQSVSRALREIAKEFKIAVICAAQVNRDSEKSEESKPPLASHLRESGQIEQCAWFIGMLHRPDKTDPYKEPGLINLYVRKNRFGERPRIQYSHCPDAPAYSYRMEELK